MRMRYRDRQQAGQALAAAMGEYAGSASIVLGLPRGGVIVAREVAAQLALPLDVLIVRKLGAPGNPEYAIGAVAEVGEPQYSREVMHQFAISNAYLQRELAEARAEIERRKALYRDGRDLPSLVGKRAILVDDGMATGYTMLAAAVAVRQAGASEVVVAVPVGSREAVEALGSRADRVISLLVPSPFYAVGLFYDEFSQVTDDEVRAALAAAAARQGPAGA
ncbi:MAG: phosphoribosyltransferase [Bacteroidetes bacterium]|nr:phosphoribosyltransferase [Bacteroidota bacterium]MCL5026049.1 phosphoribosyltransferase [Chloroflexota bacterium]